MARPKTAEQPDAPTGAEAAPLAEAPVDLVSELRASLDAETERASALERERDDTREEITQLARRFDAAWREREQAFRAELDARSHSGDAAPMPKRAVCHLALTVAGQRVTLKPGDAIPAGADLTAIPAHALKEG